MTRNEMLKYLDFEMGTPTFDIIYNIQQVLLELVKRLPPEAPHIPLKEPKEAELPTGGPCANLQD